MIRVHRLWPVALGLACVDGRGADGPGAPAPDDDTALVLDSAADEPDDPGWWGWTPCLEARYEAGATLDTLCATYVGGRAVPRATGERARMYDDLDCTVRAGDLPRAGDASPYRVPRPPGGLGVRVWCAYPGYGEEGR